VENASQSSLVSLDKALVEREAICAVVELVISEAIVCSWSGIIYVQSAEGAQASVRTPARRFVMQATSMHSSGPLALSRFSDAALQT
jgi:hypothetical protein